ncbi:FAD binding domain-containing protein [Xylariales sp. PMI_506]|nr:FAD binding domain-containing protein [Xylariales sp. PMI_506]
MGSTVREDRVDLVIVGVLACQLGVSVSVIDAKPQSLDLGRADALNARTQQYLEVVGILDGLRAKGIECNTSSTFGDGVFKSRQSHWWTGLEHCLHRNFLMIGQPDVEAALLSRLEPGTVHYGESTTSISEDVDGVMVVTDAGRTVRAKYAIGADGARSMVRNAINISFEGTKPEMIWSVLDTFLDTDFPVCSEIITFQLNGQSRVSWIPRERGMSRFYVLLDGEITQEKAENSIREHLAPYRVDFAKTEWFSTFDVKERIASTFVSKEGQGRIILVGDAAHVHSVNGGQGLNTGIADAFALGWRLATVIRNKNLAPGSASQLIKSYDTERRTVAQDVIDVAARLVRDTMHTAKQYVGTIEKNAGYITGMGVEYSGTGSSMIWQSEYGIWKAGKRCPDIILLKGETDETPTRLYSIASYGKFLLLSLGSKISPAWTHQFVGVSTHLIILPQSQSSGEDCEPNSHVYKSNSVTNEDNHVVVVRPDMYIGYIGDETGATKYMLSIFQE